MPGSRLDHHHHHSAPLLVTTALLSSVLAVASTTRDVLASADANGTAFVTASSATAAGFDCRTKEVWPADKTAWCCVMHKVGCSLDVAQPDASPALAPADQLVDVELTGSSIGADGSGEEAGNENITAGRLPGAAAPGWTRGEIEPPAGEQDLGGSTAAIYTAEQQGRLNVTKWGEPVGEATAAATAAAAAAATDQANPDLEFEHGWHAARCFCYNGTALVPPIHASDTDDDGGGHWWGGHHHHGHGELTCADDSEPICEASIGVVRVFLLFVVLLVVSTTLCCQRYCCRTGCARLLGYGGMAATAGRQSSMPPSYVYLTSDFDAPPNSPIVAEAAPSSKALEFELREVPLHQSKV